MTLPSGQTAYIFERRQHQIYRSGRVTISEALQEGEASWMIEHSALRLIQKQKLDWIIVFVVNTGDIYAAPLSTWEDKTRAKDMDTRRDRVRHLGIQHMQRTKAPIPFDRV